MKYFIFALISRFISNALYFIKTDDISNLSPSVVSTSNVMYFSSSLTIWEHIIESVFQSYNLDGNSIYKKLKEELSNILTQVKAEFDLRQPLFYKDVLPVTFESKVRLALSIMRVNIFKKICKLIKLDLKFDRYFLRA